MKRLSKTLTWSVIAFTITAIVGTLLTGDIVTGSIIGLWCRGIKLPAFWVHDMLYDRLWKEGKPVNVGAYEHQGWHEDFEDEVPTYVHHCNAG